MVNKYLNIMLQCYGKLSQIDQLLKNRISMSNDSGKLYGCFRSATRELSVKELTHMYGRPSLYHFHRPLAVKDEYSTNLESA